MTFRGVLDRHFLVAECLRCSFLNSQASSHERSAGEQSTFFRVRAISSELSVSRFSTREEIEYKYGRERRGATCAHVPVRGWSVDSGGVYSRLPLLSLLHRADLCLEYRGFVAM